MGFNVALNDDDGDNRKLQLNWSGRPHSEFTYGFLTLGPGLAADPLPGDLDGDGMVGFPDFHKLTENFGMTRGDADCDIDGDGTVGFPDFLTLSSNFGKSAAQAVPEPSGIVLWSIVGLAACLRRRRR